MLSVLFTPAVITSLVERRHQLPQTLCTHSLSSQGVTSCRRRRGTSAASLNQPPSQPSLLTVGCPPHVHHTHIHIIICRLKYGIRRGEDGRVQVRKTDGTWMQVRIGCKGEESLEQPAETAADLQQ